MKYYEQLQANNIPSQEIAQIFYDLSIMMKAEMLNEKEKNKEFPVLLNEKSVKISQLKDEIEKIKKEFKDMYKKREPTSKHQMMK